MVENENPPGDIDLGFGSAPTLPRPVKTPMYQAMNAERYLRQAKIKQIQEPNGARLLCYVAGSRAPIMRDDVVGIIELLHNVARDSNIDFLLHTGGGDIDAAEKISSMVRTTVGKGRLRVIVPDFAKSAGTLIALAADKIVMSDSSELGPIDPQFKKADGDGNARWLSVLSYLKAYENVCAKLRATPEDVPARIMLSKLDPTTVVQFEAISRRTRTLAEEHLNRWMFQRKKATYTKIAGELMDTSRWLSHGQMIGWQDAKQMELEVEYLPPETNEWREYWSLYCLQRLDVKDNEKLFEADYASLKMDAAS
jgi:serine dehydrogenase proteinase